MVRERGDRGGLHVVRCFHRFGRKRGFRECTIRNVAFDAGLGLNLHVAFDPASNFDRIAAFQFGGDIEIDNGFVDPHAVFIHGALDVCTPRPNAGDASETGND
jgi:hypothetical protein